MVEQSLAQRETRARASRQAAGWKRHVLLTVALVAASALSLGAGSAGAASAPPPSTIGHAGSHGWIVGNASNATVRAAGAQPASDCYHSIWGLPQGGSAELDVAAYGAFFDCTNKRWSFRVKTYDQWPDTELALLNVLLGDNSQAGCSGFRWLLQASYQSGSLVSHLVSVPSCSQSTWTTVASDSSVSRSSSSTVTVAIGSAALGSPTVLDWAGSVRGISETTGDFFPASGQHVENGFAGGACVGPDPSGWSPSAALVGRPQQAAGILRAAGLSSAPTDAQTVSVRGDPLAAAATLAGGGVLATIVQENFYRWAAAPNDPGYASQWPLASVNAPAAWSLTHGSSSVVVADIDSGVDATHPDLANKLVAGWDSAANAPLPAGNSDLAGHGTAVAGVIGAQTDNGTGLASLGWNTMVMPVRAGDQKGASTSAVASGIRWATDHGARIINLSLGSACSDQLTASAVDYAQAHNALVVAAAGNDLQTGDHVQYPAALPNVVAVAATGPDGKAAFYSNVGSYVSVAAPGGSHDGIPADDVPLLAPGGGTVSEAGTSFAAPLVTATGALIMAVRPDLSASAVAAIIESTASDPHDGNPRPDTIYGAGNLDAGAAVAKALTTNGSPAPPGGQGYWLLGRDGGVFSFGTAGFHGSTGNLRLNRPVVGIAAKPGRDGYWFVASDGGIFAFGAQFFGSMGGRPLNQPIVGMAATPDGSGYWLVASDGGVFSFGNAAFYGSTGAIHLNQPIVAIAATPDGHGYWFVAADGGVFNYGDAGFFGSGAGKSSSPVVGIASTTDGQGYLLVTSDGGVQTFGDARFFGSAAGLLHAPLVGIASTPGGGGYHVAATDGEVGAFGDAQALGGITGRLNAPIVGIG